MTDSLAIRLGGLAADLARIVSFSKNVKAIQSVANLLTQSVYWIELSAPHLLPDRIDEAVQLVDIQRSLIRWNRSWNQLQSDPVQRAQLAEQAQAWSDRVLAMSGLLQE